MSGRSGGGVGGGCVLCRSGGGGIDREEVSTGRGWRWHSSSGVGGGGIYQAESISGGRLGDRAASVQR